MKTQHIQEMSAWQDDKRPEPDFLLFRGILVGIPIGAALWTPVLWVLWTLILRGVW